MESDILTVDELHSYLKIPKPTLYNLAQHGRIPAAKIGRHWRFRKSAIDEWIDSRAPRLKPAEEPVDAS